MSLQLPETGQQQPGYSALDCLQGILDQFPRLLHELHDPADVDQAVGALKTLTGVQKRLMQGNGAPAQG